MRVEPTSVSPDYATVGEVGKWRIAYVTSAPLPSGTTLTLERRYSSQLAFAWQTDDPEGPNYVCASGSQGVGLKAAKQKGLVGGVRVRVTFLDRAAQWVPSASMFWQPRPIDMRLRSGTMGSGWRKPRADG